MTTTTAALAPIAGLKLAPAILAAWMVAGILDISDAAVQTVIAGGHTTRMLQGIASAIIGKDAAVSGGLVTAMVGLGLHFAIMLVIASVFVLAASRLPALVRKPWLFGPLYGFGVYLVMYRLVMPMRWPSLWTRIPQPMDFANDMFAHLVLVGLPIGLITAYLLRRQPAA